MLRLALSNKTGLDVPADDYVFHAVLRCGRVVSKPGKRLYTEAIDLAQVDGSNLVFQLTVLEASRILDLFPSFGERGLPGVWRMQASSTFVKLARPFEPYELEKVKAFLLQSSSASFVRSRYESSLAVLGPPQESVADAAGQR